MWRIRLPRTVLALTLLGQMAGAQDGAGKSIEVVATVPAANVPIILKTVVHYDDLDISTTAGATALLDRINTTAMRICTKRRTRKISGLPARIYEICQRDAVADAVQRLDSPEVSRALATVGR